MPLYSYTCADCDRTRQEMRLIADREDVLPCESCGQPMKLEISPVAGIVKNPAVPRGSK